MALGFSRNLETLGRDCKGHSVNNVKRWGLSILGFGVVKIAGKKFEEDERV